MGGEVSVQARQAVLAGIFDRASQHREELLQPEYLARQIYFEGNRPRVNEAFCAELVATIVVEVSVSVVDSGPLDILKKFGRAIVDAVPNTRRAAINLKYEDRFVAKLDKFDGQLAELAERIDRVLQKELWDACLEERLATLRQEMEELGQEYRRDWIDAGWLEE